MSPHPSAESGKREERDIVHQIKALPGWDARRVPLSGASEGFKGDVIVVSPDGHEFRLESKVRKESAGQGIKTLTGWLGRNDILWMRLKGRNKPVIVIPWDVFFEILEHWQKGTEREQTTAHGEMSSRDQYGRHPADALKQEADHAE